MLELWILCGVLASIIGMAKRRSGCIWLILGLLLGIIGLIIVLCLPAIEKSPTTNPYDYAPCPFCREPVLKDAIKCKHCHSALIPLQQESEINPIFEKVGDFFANLLHRPDQKLVPCRLCGVAIPPDVDRCPNCRTKLR